MEIKKNCIVCNNSYLALRISQKYCSKKCKTKISNKLFRQQEKNKLKAKEYHKLYYLNNKILLIQTSKNWQIKNIDKKILIQKKYNISEKGKKSIRNSDLKGKYKFYEKWEARQILSRDKKKNPNKYEIYCKICGSDKKIHQHHEDYTQPLEVIALCPICHTKLHKGELI